MKPVFWIFAGVTTEILLSMGQTFILNRRQNRETADEKLKIDEIHACNMEYGCWIYTALCIIFHFLSLNYQGWVWNYFQLVFLISMFNCLFYSIAYQVYDYQPFYGDHGGKIQYMLCILLAIAYMLLCNQSVKVFYAILAAFIFAQNIWIQFTGVWKELLKRSTYNYDDLVSLYLYPLLPLVFFVIKCF